MRQFNDRHRTKHDVAASTWYLKNRYQGFFAFLDDEPIGYWWPMPCDELASRVATLESAIAHGPIVPTATPDEIRRYLTSRYDFTEPLALDDVAADVERMLRTWQVQVTHPRYFGLFNPSVTLASVVADTLVAMYNPQLATWRTSPAANEIERHTLGWLAAKFGFPADAIASFTSGGAEANLSAVVVALTRAFPGYGEGGLRALSASPTIYLTGEAHHSFSKIAHMTGLGRTAIRTVATDRDLKIDLGDLARRVAEDRRRGFAPFMVVGTAGTTAAGAIDPLPALARFSRAEALWLHVDAAWGGAAIISPSLRGHLAGIDAADSITCDAHKWFSVPMGAGMFFCRHPDAVGEAFRAQTSYMPGKTAGPVFDPYTTSVQWSRRFIGRWCASPGTGWTPPSSWRPSTSARSLGCRKSDSVAALPSCARASRASAPPSRTSSGWSAR